MSNIRDKAIEAIKEAMKTDRVVVERLEFIAPSINEPLTQVSVTVIVGDSCRRMHFDMDWDGETEKFRDILGADGGLTDDGKGLIYHWKQEFNSFRLSNMSKTEIFALLKKANRRRKSVERKVRKLRKLLPDVWNNRNKAVESRQRTIEGQWEVMHELQRRGLVSTEDLEKVLWDVMKVRRPRFGNV